MKRKVLFFCGGAYISGMEVVMLHLMKGLKDEGFEIRCVYSGWNDGNFKNKLNEIGVPGYELKIGWFYMRKPLWTLDTLINFPKAYLDCKKIITDFKPDIFQFCNSMSAIMIGKLLSDQVVFNIQEAHSKTWKNKIIYNILKKKVKIFTTVSNHMLKVLKDFEIPSERIEVIYNGIPPVTGAIISNSNLHLRNVLNIAIIGQVVYWKGHAVLVEAVKKLINSGISNFKILIYGNHDTPFTKQLETIIQRLEIESYFEWKGFIDNQDLVYSNCDIIVVPSLSAEPCSLTVIESMSRGKAVIVSNRGGNPELVQDRTNGMVFKAEQPQQLADCIAEFISNRDLIKNFGEAARDRALEYFTQQKMTGLYVALYNRMLEGKNS